MNLASEDLENLVSLLTEVADGVAMGVHHLKASHEFTVCGVPLSKRDFISHHILPACEVCFKRYYEVI